MTKILIVDDHAVVRGGIKHLLNKKLEISIVDEVENGREALKQICHNKYDIVLLDIALRGESGLDILKQIRNYDSKLPVLILSMYSEEHYAYRALRLGASGYVTKDNSPEELVRAIMKILKGGQYLSSEFEETLLLDKDTCTDMKPHENLSNRELQIACMIASGKAVSEIGDELFLSVKTISTHRANILMKMKMKNNAEITHYAIKEGLVK